MSNARGRLCKRPKSRSDDRQPPNPVRQPPATAHQNENRGNARRYRAKMTAGTMMNSVKPPVYPDDAECDGQRRNIRGHSS